MSNAALTWAFAQDIRPATRKFVLVALADCANHHDEAFPSIPALETMTGLNRKTIIACLDELQVTGHLQDTGKRTGATRQIPVYRVCHAVPTQKPEAAPRRVKQSRKRNSTENGTVPILPDNSTVFTDKQSQFYAETVPFSGHGTPRNPKGTPKEPQVVERARQSDPQEVAAASTSTPENKPERKPKAPALSDAEWLIAVRGKPEYAGLCLDAEISNCRAWCVKNQATFTRRRILNWLGRAEPTLDVALPDIPPPVPPPRRQSPSEARQAEAEALAEAEMQRSLADIARREAEALAALNPNNPGNWQTVLPPMPRKEIK